jgi:hypothetical protein
MYKPPDEGIVARPPAYPTNRSKDRKLATECEWLSDCDLLGGRARGLRAAADPSAHEEHWSKNEEAYVPAGVKEAEKRKPRAHTFQSLSNSFCIRSGGNLPGS